MPSLKHAAGLFYETYSGCLPQMLSGPIFATPTGSQCPPLSRWGSVCLIACWAPPDARAGSPVWAWVPLDTPLQGHALWNLALFTPDSARNDQLLFDAVSLFVMLEKWSRHRVA